MREAGESEKLKEKLLKVRRGGKKPLSKRGKAMEMSCVEVFIFICRIFSRNLTSTEIISIEIG